MLADPAIDHGGHHRHGAGDVDLAIGVARQVEEVIGRPLPGQVMKAGPRLRLRGEHEVRTAVG